jgi:Phytanoyl-CoA dioxygenase (PhyH)
MPLETGPTMYLPHSHKFGPGFLAMDLPEFQEFFVANRRQIAFRKGDVLVFNPAVMHAAGANSTNDVRRLANLLQISSAFGRPIATVARGRILQAIYPILRERRATDPGQRIQSSPRLRTAIRTRRTWIWSRLCTTPAGPSPKRISRGARWPRLGARMRSSPPSKNKQPAAEARSSDRSEVPGA